MSQQSEISPKGEYCRAYDVWCPYKSKHPGSCAKVPITECERMAKEAKDGSKV